MPSAAWISSRLTADVVTEEKLARIDAALDQAKNRLDRISLDRARPPLGARRRHRPSRKIPGAGRRPAARGGRAHSLGQYATKVQLETTEGAFRTDEAALAAAQSQLRTLAATAQQEWGTVIGRAIIERSPVITRLIERTDFLVQVTLPPGETLTAPPAIAHAEVPPQSERVALRYVSPATRTDQRI